MQLYGTVFAYIMLSGLEKTSYRSKHRTKMNGFWITCLIYKFMELIFQNFFYDALSWIKGKSLLSPRHSAVWDKREASKFPVPFKDFIHLFVNFLYCPSPLSQKTLSSLRFKVADCHGSWLLLQIYGWYLLPDLRSSDKFKGMEKITMHLQTHPHNSCCLQQSSCSTKQ